MILMTPHLHVLNNSLLSQISSKGSRSRLPKPQRGRRDDLGKKADLHLFSYAARCVGRQPANSESFMSDNSDNSFTDKYSPKRASQVWERDVGVSASGPELLDQRDTFYTGGPRRLKLREFSDGTAIRER